jgi:nucleoside 2-deoxyribosyltransferase
MPTGHSGRVPCYLASPLGFAASTRPFLGRLRRALEALDVTLCDPWIDPQNKILSRKIRAAERKLNGAQRKKRLADLNLKIGRNNEDLIRSCSLMVAVLDGADVDSGTASEVGFAAAHGLTVVGLRTDFRRSGENEASIVNPQLEWWIHRSGGKIVRTIADLLDSLKEHIEP